MREINVSAFDIPPIPQELQVVYTCGQGLLHFLNVNFKMFFHVCGGAQDRPTLGLAAQP